MPVDPRASLPLPSSFLREGAGKAYLEPAVDRSMPGCWMRLLIAKTLLSLPRRNLAPVLKGGCVEADRNWTDWTGKGQDRKEQQETEAGKEKRRNHEPVPNHSSVSGTL